MVQIDQPDSKLKELAYDGFRKRMVTMLSIYPENNTDQQLYWDRLASELDIIKQTQLSSYFLIMSDVVSWAKDCGIPVGPGRGAIVGSLVAYAIRITEVDPLRYNLLFERFLNKERRIVPVVDFDFCIDRRNEVAQYVMKKYGGEQDNDGCRIRVNLPQAEMNHEKITCHLVLNLQGQKHLTTNNKVAQLIRAGKSPAFDLANLRDDDPTTLKLIASGNTRNIFQFATGGIREFSKKLMPSCFEELIAVLSLFRPAPILTGVADDVIKRKHGQNRIVTSQLAPILKDTYGVVIYQEQFMEIFHTIGGYSLGEADSVRRGLVKMNSVTLSTNKERFLAGAQKQGISTRTATIIFNRLTKYGEYLFLKAHAAAYATISYETAYLKTHYPEEFEAVYGK